MQSLCGKTVNQASAMTEETIKTGAGFAKVSHLETESGCVIPVALNDYETSQLVQKVCNRHKR
jgi:hypothetical protein